MHHYLLCLIVLAPFLISSGSSYSCSANHGYTRTAAAINQSTLASKRKKELGQMLAKSRGYHDNYTALGD